MYYGAQYYRPPFPRREVWRRDIAHMGELGFNVVKLWAVWNWVEREEGVFDFSELDELVALCAEQGLSVVVNTIPEGAPYWTSGQTEDFYQTAEGEVLRYSGPANIPSAGWPGLCPDSPASERLVARFIEATAAHFAGNRAVVAIDVWNEPHLEPMFDYSGKLLCYCAHSQRRFTEWLKERYGSLDALNKAWFRAYTAWEQAEPPRRFGTAADMVDWRRFWLDNLARWLRLRTAAARKGAPDLPVQTHTAFSAYMGANNEGGLANELGDEFLLAREVDLFGLSSFPRWLMGEDHVNGHFLNVEIVAEASRGKPFYQVELQGGAGKAGLLGGFVPSAEDVRQWNWSVAAAGGKGVLYWQYSYEPAGMESPGFGLVRFDGEDTPRSLAAGESARRFTDAGLDEAERCLSSNAIYLSRNADLLCYAMGDEESYNHSFKGIWKLLGDAGIPSRFVHGDYVDELLTEGVENLYLPMALALSEAEKDGLLRYVRGGGRLILEGAAGMYGENALLDEDFSLLGELFGMEGVSLDKTEKIHAADAAGTGSFDCVFYRQYYARCAESCRVVATFTDGAPAALENRVGEGSALWLGGFVGKGYWTAESADTRAFLTPYFSPTGYAFIEELDAGAMTVRALETEDEYLLFCLNRAGARQSLSLRALGRDYTETVPAKDGVLLHVPKR